LPPPGIHDDLVDHDTRIDHPDPKRGEESQTTPGRFDEVRSE
jgi:hypothetical protein